MLIIQLYIQEIAFSFQMIQIKCINHWRMLFHFWRLHSVCSVGKNAGLFHMSTFTFPDMVLNIRSRHVYLSMSKEHFHGTVTKKFLKGFPSYVILVVLFNLHFNAIGCFDKVSITLREKCPYSKFFWSVFSGIWTEYKKVWAR